MCIPQRISDRNEALLRIGLRTMLEKIISLKAKMGDHWHRRGLWRQARLTARNKLLSVSFTSWSEQKKLVRISLVDVPSPLDYATHSLRRRSAPSSLKPTCEMLARRRSA